MIELRLSNHYYRRILIIAVLAAAVLFGAVKAYTTIAFAGSTTLAAGERVVTIHDGSTRQGIVTSATTLRQVLQQAHITLNKGDITEPGLDDPLVASSYEANIYRARPVVVQDGAKSIRIITAYRTVKQIAQQAGVPLNYADTAEIKPAVDIASVGAAEIMVINRATPVSFVFYGKTIQTSTRATTVGGLLKEHKITPAQDDTVVPALNAPIVPGMTIELWRNGKQTVTVDESINFTTRQVLDANHNPGYKVVQTPGQMGSRTVTYDVEMRNGKEISRTETNEIVTKQPVEQVVVIGVKGAYTTPSENESITWSYLMSKGLSREQTAGIMGNLMQEHGFQTSGDGLAQWTGSRKANLEAMFPDTYRTIQSQLDYMWYELSGPYSNTLALVRAQTTVQGAEEAFQNHYEGCGICVQDRRIQFAFNILASH